MKNWEKVLKDKENTEAVYRKFIEELADKYIDFYGPICDECRLKGKCSILTDAVDCCKIGTMMWLDSEVKEDE